MPLTLTDESANLPAHRRPDRTLDDVRLPPVQRWTILTVLVAIFLVGGERPVWDNPFDIDRAAWLSYAPIPLLVLGGLWLAKRLSLVTWVLNTVEIVTAKFAITYLIAIPLWATSTYQPPEPAQPAAPLAAPAPEPPTLAPLEIGVAEGGFEVASAVVQPGQPLVGRSRDGQLHPLRFTKGREVLLMTSVLAGGGPSPIATHGLADEVLVTCVLHGESMTLTVAEGEAR